MWGAQRDWFDGGTTSSCDWSFVRTWTRSGHLLCFMWWSGPLLWVHLLCLGGSSIPSWPCWYALLITLLPHNCWPPLCILGLSGKGRHSCWYCHKPVMYFHVTKWPIKHGDESLNAPAKWGNFETVYDKHEEVLSMASIDGSKTKGKEKLKACGWAKRLSPFWQLDWMQNSFYQCFGICLLHIEYLGLVKVPLPSLYWPY